jgi:hypothetical protein
VKKIIMAVVLCTGLATLSFAAGDMQLTLDDGREVVLHEDYTWGFAQFSILEGEQEDLYINLPNGKIICLKSDNSWKYTNTQPKKKSVRELPNVFASGTAKRATLDLAVQAATQDAIQRCATRLKTYVPNTKTAQQFLVACIKNEVGEHGAEVKYSPGWNAEAKISLDKLQARKIVACVEEQVAAQTPPPAPAPATVPAATDK